MKKIQPTVWQLVLALFLAVCWTVQAEPRRGEILKVEKDHITVVPSTPPKENGRDEPSTYILDDQTRVFVSRATSEKENADGSKTRKYDSTLGNRDDLKIGLRAWVDADGDRAIRVTVFIDDLKSK